MKKIGFFCIVWLSCLCGLAWADNSPPQHLEKLTVALDWIPNPDHAPLVTAAQQGYFKEAGLDVQFVTPKQANEPIDWVINKKADIALAYQPDYMRAVDDGAPLIRVGTLIDKPLNCLVVLKSSGIKNLAELKGKRIAIRPGPLSTLILTTMLKKQGLKIDDVEIVDIKTDLAQALLKHKVDAAIGMLRNFEVPLLELHNQKVMVYFPEEHGIPSYSELIFIGHTDGVHDSRLPKFLTALKKGATYLDEHPKTAWHNFVLAYPSADTALNRQAWFATLPYFSEDPAHFNQKRWQRFANFLQSHNIIKKSQPVSRYAVTLTA